MRLSQHLKDAIIAMAPTMSKSERAVAISVVMGNAHPSVLLKPEALHKSCKPLGEQELRKAVSSDEARHALKEYGRAKIEGKSVGVPGKRPPARGAPSGDPLAGRKPAVAPERRVVGGVDPTQPQPAQPAGNESVEDKIGVHRWGDHMLEAMRQAGYEPTDAHADGDYQGHGVIRGINRQTGHHGVLSQSWGSCGHCDPYEDMDNYRDPQGSKQRIVQEMTGDIQHFSPEQKDAADAAFEQGKGW